MCSIVSLTQLYLPDNFLVSLPSSFGRFTSPTPNKSTLSLALTLSPFRLVNLEQLYLDNNVIGPTLPSEMGNLRQLRVLSISQNRLQELPLEMGKLRELENLVVDNNRLGWLPSELEGHKCLIEGLETNAFVRESVKRKVFVGNWGRASWM